jgi:hypothetical protein
MDANSPLIKLFSSTVLMGKKYEDIIHKEYNSDSAR